MPISDSRARGFVGIRQSGGAGLHGGGGRVVLDHEARLRDERAADAGLAHANCAAGPPTACIRPSADKLPPFGAWEQGELEAGRRRGSLARHTNRAAK
jgi:hypothetical protein